MLYRTHVLSALEERREQFVSFERGLRDGVGELAARLRALAGRTGEEVRRASESEGKRVTYPSNELEGANATVVPFGERWRSHEEARRWALGALSNRVTFAADGSQLYPGREASVPVAAVQVASFENPHSPEGRYLKDVHFELITPDELCAGGRGYDSPEQVVGARRFELEAEAVCAFLERRRGWRARGERMPLAFFDNTLVFSSPRGDSETFFSKRYASALARLITLSREAEVPVVGYVDHSYAPDVRDLLEAFYRDLPETNVYDAQMFHARAPEGDARLLDAWGDRTIFWYCRRRGLAASFFDEAGTPLVGFVYLQTTADGHPARLDIPAWAQEAGLLEEVLDAVRAECVVGNGYPYAVETADEAAVMTARDREQFLRVMQDFAAEHRLDFGLSRKPASKARRR
ncbi:MAG TPA: DNA double-strand break repair nuclease NurA [Pyrinomonadaceae bacterium]|nr:DNA double-strand break repair nuclease NurA [Pyrinomonadaceae bacterium]